MNRSIAAFESMYSDIRTVCVVAKYVIYWMFSIYLIWLTIKKGFI